MEPKSRTELIRAGWWLGIGLLIPMTIASLFVLLIMTFGMQYVMTSMMSDSLSATVNDPELAAGLEISETRPSRVGTQLVVLGTVTNKGDGPVTSAQLEAELLDADGKMVYECTEHLSDRLEPGASEEFQIRCGCGDNPAPEFASLRVTVVDANNF